VFHAAAVSLRRELRRRLGMRVIDCNECGETIEAANDEELARALDKHMKSEHSDLEWDDDQTSELVSNEAYDATDS
jgi:predicted small metal-binding protein